MKDTVRLRGRRARENVGRFLIEGYRELSRAVDSGLPIEDIYICPELYLGENEPELVERAEKKNNDAAEVKDYFTRFYRKNQILDHLLLWTSFKIDYANNYLRELASDDP